MPTEAGTSEAEKPICNVPKKAEHIRADTRLDKLLCHAVINQIFPGHEYKVSALSH